MLPAFNWTFTCWIFCFVNYLFTCFSCLFADLRLDPFFGSFRDVHPQVFCKYVSQMPLFLLYRIYGLICPSFTLWLFLSLLYLEIQHTLQFLINDQYNSTSFHFMFARFCSFIHIRSLFLYNFSFIFSVSYMFISLSIWWAIPVLYIAYLCLAFFSCLKDMKWLYI